MLTMPDAMQAATERLEMRLPPDDYESAGIRWR
jgi:hypothetical protein